MPMLNRYNQNNYQYLYIKNEIYGFRFVMQEPVTGSSNSGRLSIGNINLFKLQLAQYNVLEYK